MLSSLVGNIDFNAAIVLAVGFIVFGVIATSLIVKRRSRQDVSNEFELAKMKIEEEYKSAQYRNETNRSIEFKKLDQGLITSHRQD